MLGKSELFLFFWVWASLLEFISSSETGIRFSRGDLLTATCLFGHFAFAISFFLLGAKSKFSKGLLLGALCFQVASAFCISPELPNHQILQMAVNLILIVDLLTVKGFGVSPQFFRSAKILTVTTYGFAVLHKLNADYLNVTTSCATLFTEDLARYFPALSFIQPLTPYAPVGSLICEGFLALLLFLPRRFAAIGVGIGFVFHSILALHVERHFFDFSGLMMCLLLLFLPGERTVRAVPVWVRSIIVLGFAYSYINLLEVDHGQSFSVFLTRLRLWLVFSIAIGFYAYLLIRRLRSQPAVERERVEVVANRTSDTLRPLSIAVITFIVLTGFGPYLGFKTRHAFDMYSNLQVEEGQSNHLLIPASMQLGLLTDDVVEVLDFDTISGEPLKFRSDVLVKGTKIVRFQLMSLLSRNLGLKVKILDHGIPRELESADQVYPNSWVAPWLLRKSLAFRPISAAGRPQYCVW